MPSERFNWILWLHAKLYQLTGYYSNYAKAKELEIWKGWLKNIDKWCEEAEDMDMYPYDYIGIRVGSWQAHYGFYRRMKGKIK